MTAGRGGVLALGLLALACAGTGRPEPESEALLLPVLARDGSLPATVILVSVSGLTPERYTGDLGSVDMPVLASLARQGIWAGAVRSVAPAAAYPAHATLLSGQLPAAHGIASDRLLGTKGVRATPYWHVSHLRAPTLWQVAAEDGRRVLALAWPSTVGASIPQLIPDLVPSRQGETWLGVLADAATPELLQGAARAGGGASETDRPGPERDAVLVAIACDGLQSSEPPDLLLLHLSQTREALRGFGPGSPRVAAAFASADALVARLLSCLRTALRLESAAILVVGDHGTLDVHTSVFPNAILREQGLIRMARSAPGSTQTGIASWSAIARSNGGSAFVYAESEGDAVRARRALVAEAESSHAFRVISAREMLEISADPEAWFGLEAEPGFVFGDSASRPVLRPAAIRGAWGYLPDRAEMDAGFVAWGRGIRVGVRIPHMQLADVAPTVARLLGVDLGDVEGRTLVGALEPKPSVSSGTPGENPVE
jgi:hypothetical protein